jgi:hypothetical protein
MERRQLLKAAPAALLLGGAGGLVAPAAVAGATPPSVGNDAHDVLNALYKWSLGYDSRDEALMMSAFSDDPTFIFRTHTGSETTFEGFRAVRDLFRGALAGQTDQRRHITTNPVMDRRDRRTVKVTSYLLLVSIELDDTQPPDRGLRVVTTGVYRDTVVKGRDGVWRIDVRDLTLDGPSA